MLYYIYPLFPIELILCYIVPTLPKVYYVIRAYFPFF